MTIATLGDVRSTSSGHPAQDQESTELAEPRTSRGRTKSIVFAVAGIAGLLSILWLVASLVFGLSVIVFKTGSMAPTMPAGSMAITRWVPAAAIRVGDVVTVPVPGKVLPVTHRVVSVATIPAVPDDRSLVLKGDDNLTPDQVPYTVGRTKLVIFSLPVAGTVLALFQTPPFIGLTSLIVAGLLLWAFWPAARSTESAPTPNRAHPARTTLPRGERP
jgi:signal peptidase